MSVKKSLRIGGQSYVRWVDESNIFGEAAQEAQDTEHAQACRSFGVNHYLLWGTGRAQAAAWFGDVQTWFDESDQLIPAIARHSPRGPCSELNLDHLSNSRTSGGFFHGRIMKIIKWIGIFHSQIWWSDLPEGRRFYSCCWPLTFWLAFVPLNDQGFNGMYPWPGL